VRASFSMTVDNSSEVAAICRHLDGLPLAIELTAARSKLLGPRALLTRLDRALDLRGSDADRPTRQQALRDTIDWSYRLLGAPQQSVFRRLGVFAGGAALDALAAVCADAALGERDPLELVEELVDASLVTVTEDEDGEPRLGMLETVRSFALDALSEAGELEAARRLHATHYADVAAQLSFFVIWASHEQAIRSNRMFELGGTTSGRRPPGRGRRPIDPKPASPSAVGSGSPSWPGRAPGRGAGSTRPSVAASSRRCSTSRTPIGAPNAAPASTRTPSA
jgi:predicted ATPase